MSVFKDLLTASLDAIESLETKFNSRDIEDICVSLGASKNREIFENVVDEILVVKEDDLAEGTDREYRRMLDDYGIMIAEYILLSVILDRRLKSKLTDRELDRLEQSASEFNDIVEDGRRRNRDRDRDREPKRNRRDRGRDRGRGRDNNRRSRSRDRDRDGDELRVNRDRSADRRSEHKDHHEEETVAQETVSTELEQNSILTADNFSAIPKYLRDLPLYYVGLEKLVYKDDAVEVVVFGENFNVDYQKHRTDIYLSPNRQPQHAAKTLEAMEEDLLEASKKSVKAFIDKDTFARERPNEPYIEIPAPITAKNAVVQGVYLIDEPILGFESIVRETLADSMGKDSLNHGVMALTAKQIVSPIPGDFTDGKDPELTKLFESFKNVCNMISVSTTFQQIKDMLELASDILPADGYETFHRIVNQAVCDAITVSTKLSVVTKTLLVDIDEVVAFVDNMSKEDPNIGAVIFSNLLWALPKFFIEDDAVYAVRNYIFLPFSKNELVYGSPTRYATIDEQNKQGLFAVVDKLFNINQAEIGYDAFTTIVTTDNGLLYVLPNKSSTKVKSYYVIKEIE